MWEIPKPEKRRRVGILGGTFDPIHAGHLILGEECYLRLSLDEVIFLPAGNPPHKQHRDGRATDAQRVEMVRLAIADNPHFSLSLMEMERQGLTYTWQTLALLREQYPDTDYFLILGADSLADFEYWREPERIASACTVVTGVRDELQRERLVALTEHLKEHFHSEFLLVENPDVQISSSDLRRRRGEGESLRYLVPEAVRQYIEKENIYSGGAYGQL